MAQSDLARQLEALVDDFDEQIAERDDTYGEVLKLDAKQRATEQTLIDFMDDFDEQVDERDEAYNEILRLDEAKRGTEHQLTELVESYDEQARTLLCHALTCMLLSRAPAFTLHPHSRCSAARSRARCSTKRPRAR
jgi:hypothetical protein